MPGPFRMRSGNSPLFKAMGASDVEETTTWGPEKTITTPDPDHPDFSITKVKQEGKKTTGTKIKRTAEGDAAYAALTPGQRKEQDARVLSLSSSEPLSREKVLETKVSMDPVGLKQMPVSETKMEPKKVRVPRKANLKKGRKKKKTVNWARIKHKVKKGFKGKGSSKICLGQGCPGVN